MLCAARWLSSCDLLNCSSELPDLISSAGAVVQDHLAMAGVFVATIMTLFSAASTDDQYVVHLGSVHGSQTWGRGLWTAGKLPGCEAHQSCKMHACTGFRALMVHQTAVTVSGSTSTVVPHISMMSSASITQ